jgi:demethylmenaquinone methyltransferase/2-methoxy-6-polyprenyl-1,4-benzoquinol methylase
MADISTEAPIQVSARHRPKTPQATFDRVAPYYDRFNSLLSLGLDRRWRGHAVEALALQPGQRVLDVATGTGALALSILRKTRGTVSVTGCDLNQRMLSVARQRLADAPGQVELCCCDATQLPFAAASFDAATLAFAIDDMPDRDACIAEIARVLRPGARFVLLELSQPDTQPLKAAYDLYLDAFRLLRRVRVDGYDHLAEEIRGYRGPEAIAELLGRHAFGQYTRKALTGGIARIHVATRLQTPS